MFDCLPHVGWHLSHSQAGLAWYAPVCSSWIWLNRKLILDVVNGQLANLVNGQLAMQLLISILYIYICFYMCRHLSGTSGRSQHRPLGWKGVASVKAPKLGLIERWNLQVCLSS